MNPGNYIKTRKLLISMTFGFLIAIFAGCEKTDYNKLEGSTWEAEVNDVVFTLQFLDESTCTLESIGKDINSENLTLYHWRYRGEYDSMWGLFFMYSKDDESGHPYSGTVEDKKLYLHIFENDIETLCFKKIK